MMGYRGSQLISQGRAKSGIQKRHQLSALYRRFTPCFHSRRTKRDLQRFVDLWGRKSRQFLRILAREYRGTASARIRPREGWTEVTRCHKGMSDSIWHALGMGQNLAQPVEGGATLKNCG